MRSDLVCPFSVSVNKRWSSAHSSSPSQSRNQLAVNTSLRLLDRSRALKWIPIPARALFLPDRQDQASGLRREQAPSRLSRPAQSHCCDCIARALLDLKSLACLPDGIRHVLARMQQLEAAGFIAPRSPALLPTTGYACTFLRKILQLYSSSYVLVVC